jgi:hypothetical protein
MKTMDAKWVWLSNNRWCGGTPTFVSITEAEFSKREVELSILCQYPHIDTVEVCTVYFDEWRHRWIAEGGYTENYRYTP